MGLPRSSNLLHWLFLQSIISVSIRITEPKYNLTNNVVNMISRMWANLIFLRLCGVKVLSSLESKS